MTRLAARIARLERASLAHAPISPIPIIEQGPDESPNAFSARVDHELAGCSLPAGVRPPRISFVLVVRPEASSTG